MKMINNQIYTLNTKLPVFITKNPEASKIIVIFENEHDKNQSKM